MGVDLEHALEFGGDDDLGVLVQGPELFDEFLDGHGDFSSQVFSLSNWPVGSHVMAYTRASPL